MPNTKSAIRRVRRVAIIVNRVKKAIKSAVKHMGHLKKGDKSCKRIFSKFQSILMQVAKKGVVIKKQLRKNF